jgi:hypothetical protein
LFRCQSFLTAQPPTPHFPARANHDGPLGGVVVDLGLVELLAHPSAGGTGLTGTRPLWADELAGGGSYDDGGGGCTTGEVAAGGANVADGPPMTVGG